MAQYEAPNSRVHVNKASILAVINSMRRGKQRRIEILEKHGIIINEHSTEKEWYPIQPWLNTFKEIADMIGDQNLFIIGGAILSNSDFPPMENLEEALNSLNIAYHMNHQLDGELMFNQETGTLKEGIGHYTLQSFDAINRKAVMNCNNPYPSKFDEGLISQIVHLFKPKDSTFEEVKIDITKERRTQGGDSCTYLIRW